MKKMLRSTCVTIIAGIGIANAQLNVTNTGAMSDYPDWGYSTPSYFGDYTGLSHNGDNKSYKVIDDEGVGFPYIVSPALERSGTTLPTFHITFWLASPFSSILELNGYTISVYSSPIKVDAQSLIYESGGPDWSEFSSSDLTTTDGLTLDDAVAFNPWDDIPESNEWHKVTATITGRGTGPYYYIGISYNNNNGYTYLIDDINITSADILPVKYVQQLTVTSQANNLVLNWTTATEINDKGFTIQRSADGKTFASIGYVASQAANGNSTKTLSYTYTDASPLQGKNYYRLAQEDLDGKSTPSGIVSIDFSGAGGGLNVYPNPAHGSITVSGLQPGNNAAVYSANGQAVKHFSATGSTQQIDISSLAAGVYFVKVLNGNGKASASFIVK